MSNDERRTEIGDDEKICLHCMPVAWENEQAIRIPGTAEFKCEDCGQPILVAPTGQALIASHGASVYCVPCGNEKMAEEGQEVSHPTDAQIKEVRDALFRERL